MSRKKVIIIGAGGHAKVVIDTIQNSMSNELEIIGVLDNGDIDEIYGVKKIGGFNDIIKYKDCYFHIALGNENLRISLSNLIGEEKLVTVVHKTAFVSNKSIIAKGVYIGAMCVVNPNVKIGLCSIINTGSIIEHDSEICDFAHLSYRTLVGSNCKVKNKKYLEMGTILLRNEVV